MVAIIELELVRYSFYFTWAITEDSFQFTHVMYMCKHAMSQSTLNHLLMHATHAGHFRAVKYLILAGADIHMYGDQPLRWSIHKGSLKIVRFLCRRGAHVNAQSGTPLYIACSRKKRFRFVQCLVGFGAAVNDYHLRTAINSGQMKTVQYLLNCGLKINNHHVYMIDAIEKGHIELVRFLVENGVYAPFFIHNFFLL